MTLPNFCFVNFTNTLSPAHVTMSQTGPGGRLAPRPADRTRGDIGPDNFCGEIKVLESDRFLFSQHLSNPGWDWVSLMRGQCGSSNHVYTGHSPHDLDTRHCINICHEDPDIIRAVCWITAKVRRGDKVVNLSRS